MVGGVQPSWQHRGGSGYPFGRSELVFKSIPSRWDVRLGCTIESGDGLKLGLVQSITTGRWPTVAQFLSEGMSASWEFNVVSTDGTPLCHLRRPRPQNWRSRHERFGVCDAGGRYTGRLLQNNSYTSGIRTFNLETPQGVLGYTTFEYKRIGPPFGDHTARTVTIHDANGGVVAGIVERRPFLSDFYDYTLTFDYPPNEPMGTFCLAVAVAEYFYRRTMLGGTLRTFPGR